MPTISKFDGYKIYMFYNDHQPPHIHVEYNGEKSTIEILNPKNIKGDIKTKDLKVIQRWIKLREDELMNNLNLAMDNKTLTIVQPYNKKEK